MAHNHRKSVNFAFIIGTLLNTGFIIAEVIFGLLGGSVALIADAGHNISDVLALLLAWGAEHFQRLQPTLRKTYGFRSTTIMASLINAIILYIVTGAIAFESILRLRSFPTVSGKIMIIVATLGIIINSATAILFMSGRKKDLNIKGAFLHMASDAAVSAGVVIAGIAIYFTGWVWIDPAVSLAISVVIFISAWGILQEAVNLSLQGVPEGIDTRQVSDYLKQLPEVNAVHDLHIWAMSTTETALTAHVIKPDPKNDDVFLVRVRNELKNRFGIDHVTLQIERNEILIECGDICEPKLESLKGAGNA